MGHREQLPGVASREASLVLRALQVPGPDPRRLTRGRQRHEQPRSEEPSRARDGSPGQRRGSPQAPGASTCGCRCPCAGPPQGGRCPATPASLHRSFPGTRPGPCHGPVPWEYAGAVPAAQRGVGGPPDRVWPPRRQLWVGRGRRPGVTPAPQSLSAALRLPGVHPRRCRLRLAVSFPLASKLTDVVRLLAPARDGAAGGCGLQAGPGWASRGREGQHRSGLGWGPPAF